MKINKIAISLIAAGMMASPLAQATNGYFSHGYGMKAKGMGGAATAMSNDAFGGANNPAAMVWVGDRIDVGVDWFRPIRSSERSGAGDPTMNGTATSGSNNFAIPEFGYNRMYRPDMSLGVTVYGNGGMNTNYDGGQLSYGGTCANANPPGTPGAGFNPGTGTDPATTTYNLLCGNGNLGVDMMQLMIAPTVAYKMNENNSIGVSPLLGYQRFKAEGLQAFSGFSSDASSLTNKGYDSATGYGVRFGWQGRISDMVTLGAAYSTKMKYGKFDKYKGLFAEQGGFDTPANWNLGIAIKASPKIMVAVDYQQINYSGINSVGNSSRTALDGPPGTPGGVVNSLGGNEGRGFGWEDVKVVKLGAEYNHTDALTIRAGYSKSNNPITSRDVTFNIIAPGVISTHYTLGLTYATAKNAEFTMAYMHAEENSVTGSSLFNSWTGDVGMEKIKMYQDALGIAYSWKM